LKAKLKQNGKHSVTFYFQAFRSRRLHRGFDRVNLHRPTTLLMTMTGKMRNAGPMMDHQLPTPSVSELNLESCPTYPKDRRPGESTQCSAQSGAANVSPLWLSSSVGEAARPPGHVESGLFDINTAIRQGLTLVHFSAQPKPFCSHHIVPLSDRLGENHAPNASHKMCLRWAEMWTSVSSCH